MLFEETYSKKLQQLDRMIYHVLGEKMGGDNSVVKVKTSLKFELFITMYYLFYSLTLSNDFGVYIF